MFDNRNCKIQKNSSHIKEKINSIDSDEELCCSSAGFRLEEKRYGHWNSAQKLRYLVFLKKHREMFKAKTHRRLWRIFRAMSIFISSRSPQQCRSHHQKMENKYENLQLLENYLCGFYEQSLVIKCNQFYEAKFLPKTNKLYPNDTQIQRKQIQVQELEREVLREHQEPSKQQQYQNLMWGQWNQWSIFQQNNLNQMIYPYYPYHHHGWI